MEKLTEILGVIVSKDLFPVDRLKVAETAFVKLTNEPVFVLNVDEESDETVTVVRVRRYNQVDGEYRVEHYFADELAPLKESIHRTLTDMLSEQKIRNAFMEKQKNAEEKIIEMPLIKGQGNLFN